METKMVSCRIEVGKIEKLMALYPGCGLTSVIDSCIDYRLSGGTAAVSLSYNKKLSAEEVEGIRRLKREAAKKWNDANRDRIKEYGKKHREKHPRDKVKAEAQRQRYWLKKLEKVEQ